MPKDEFEDKCEIFLMILGIAIIVFIVIMVELFKAVILIDFVNRFIHLLK